MITKQQYLFELYYQIVSEEEAISIKKCISVKAIRQHKKGLRAITWFLSLPQPALSKQDGKVLIVTDHWKRIKGNVVPEDGIKLLDFVTRFSQTPKDKRLSQRRSKDAKRSRTKSAIFFSSISKSSMEMHIEHAGDLFKQQPTLDRTIYTDRLGDANIDGVACAAFKALEDAGVTVSERVPDKMAAAQQVLNMLKEAADV